MENGNEQRLGKKLRDKVPDNEKINDQSRLVDLRPQSTFWWQEGFYSQSQRFHRTAIRKTSLDTQVDVVNQNRSSGTAMELGLRD